MLLVAVLALLAASAAAASQPQVFFSPPVGSGSGWPYLVTGQGRITAIRVWDTYQGHVRGIQFRYDFTWSRVAGYTYGVVHELELYDDEAIVQISGKYAHYLQSVVFVTNRGRSLHAGQANGHSFNMYAGNEQSELVSINGRVHGSITSLGAHWAVIVPSPPTAMLDPKEGRKGELVDNILSQINCSASKHKL